MSQRPIRSHTFRGKRYRIVEARLHKPTIGDCDHPTTPRKRVRIAKGLDGLAHLDTVIHESLHACFWDMNEQAIDKAATDIARFVWRLGYHRN